MGDVTSPRHRVTLDVLMGVEEDPWADVVPTDMHHPQPSGTMMRPALASSMLYSPRGTAAVLSPRAGPADRWQSPRAGNVKWFV
jgi:hypothetical protein